MLAAAKGFAAFHSPSSGMRAMSVISGGNTIDERMVPGLHGPRRRESDEEEAGRDVGEGMRGKISASSTDGLMADMDMAAPGLHRPLSQQDAEEKFKAATHNAIQKALVDALPDTVEVPETLIENVSKERFADKRKRRQIKRYREQVDEATRKWRRIAKELEASPVRDSSPMPEHVPTWYVRPRSVALWRIDCAALSAKRAAKRAAAGQPPAMVYNPNRMAKTSFKLTGAHLIKIGYQRDVLLDKLRRRNERIAQLERALANAQAQ